ncbi:S-adenosylmethionine-dependent methyltransferase [Knufia obscura]|uniref:tRNA wybutosine-synthesizing protein 2 n=2 Tax=Knufia TaxID=430999 RepID=A0AAN8EC22_9EURO|nr:S-adenosylmethionine-dependent methyltransferase [Knufia obscura]KAK5951974.1 S-adenosylmethionine-dependent methyltransferase [Knufia fluminis]
MTKETVHPKNFEARKVDKRSKQGPTNSLVKGISDYILTRHKSPGEANRNLDDAVEEHNQGALPTSVIPKRYTIYEPMLLLGSNFVTQTPAWEAFYSSLTIADKHALFSTITRAFCNAGHKITHIALNAPIQPRLDEDDADGNVMRSPTNLQPLYGDFGPEKLLNSNASQPTQADFDAAFWVQTSQLSGIKQVWAPRWTMFSRGNISEKARILGLEKLNPSPFPGLSNEELGQEIGEVDVVDFYVGIGYFAFPYLERGARRVFGWDINGWSVEGLRRGCERNGVGCEVVRVPDFASEQERKDMVEHVVGVLCGKTRVRCIAFWGDNSFAGPIMGEVGAALGSDTPSLMVRHCNLGLLPTSQGSWKDAVKVIDPVQGGWLHVHENAEIDAVEQEKQHVLGVLAELVTQEKGGSWQISCEHVEMVKTYAPGVGHFVFDIKLWPAR